MNQRFRWYSFEESVQQFDWPEIVAPLISSPFSTQEIFHDKNGTLRYAIGGDHAGFLLKNDVYKLLMANAVNVIDCGTHTAESCDFPDFAEMVAIKILSGEIDRGILVCGSGVGVSVAATSFPGSELVCAMTLTPLAKASSTMT